MPKLRLSYLVGKRVVPSAARELAEWQELADDIPNGELRNQALASIRDKDFHAEGGSVYAAAALDNFDSLIRLIVALQTISDYLDNLCDRSVSMDEKDFRQLHQAMMDAVDPSPTYHDYYRFHPNQDDGGYLHSLVKTCKEELNRLPSYEVAQQEVGRLAGLYSDLQVYKHIAVERREDRLRSWFEEHREQLPDLEWWEFAAATGSTLGMFALFVEAAQPDLDADYVEKLLRAYFPWVCGLHILLDYFIDQEEDRREGDLNFITYYPDRETMAQRLTFFAREAGRRVLNLSDTAFHEFVVEGLPALYLSDEKVKQQQLSDVAWQLLRVGGPNSIVIHWVCRLRRLWNTA
jgi:tetraprenyl-beta-curcumene synthase